MGGAVGGRRFGGTMTSLIAIRHKLGAADLHEASDLLDRAVNTLLLQVDLEDTGDFVGALRELNATLAVCQRVYRETLDAHLIPPAEVPAMRPREPVKLTARPPEPPEAA